MSENAPTLKSSYGSLPASSLATVQRRLLVLEQQGLEHFFGEPALALTDFMQHDFSGNGVISVLDASSLMPNPRLYSTFLLWLLAELFEQLPEVGDQDRPKLVFFFDEAHLLFDNAPKALLDKVEQVVRLIRSKGVGIYFVSQSPLDIPEDVLGQLGNRVQHALRAFTPKDQKAVRSAAQTFRPNPNLDTEQVITELGVGEALISVLDEKGRPSPVERVLLPPPESRIGPLSSDERRDRIARSPVAGRYDHPLDRESAYEVLQGRAELAARSEEMAKAAKVAEKPAPRGRQPESMLQAMTKSALRAAGSQIGRRLVRGLLGSLLGGRR